MAQDPCLVCGTCVNVIVHHLTFSELRAMSRKTSDYQTVPLCASQHMELHSYPLGERMWWAMQGVDPIEYTKAKFAWYKEQKEWLAE